MSGASSQVGPKSTSTSSSSSSPSAPLKQLIESVVCLPLESELEKQIQWPQMWTKRRSPDWKPRRASVASCQQWHLNACKHEIKRRESSLLLPYNHNTVSSCPTCSSASNSMVANRTPPALSATSSLRDILTPSRRLQLQQLQQREAANRVSSGDSQQAVQSCQDPHQQLVDSRQETIASRPNAPLTLASEFGHSSTCCTRKGELGLEQSLRESSLRLNQAEGSAQDLFDSSSRSELGKQRKSLDVQSMRSSQLKQQQLDSLACGSSSQVSADSSKVSGSLSSEQHEGSNNNSNKDGAAVVAVKRRSIDHAKLAQQKAAVGLLAGANVEAGDTFNGSQKHIDLNASGSGLVSQQIATNNLHNNLNLHSTNLCRVSKTELTKEESTDQSNAASGSSEACSGIAEIGEIIATSEPKMTSSDQYASSDLKHEQLYSSRVRKQHQNVNNNNNSESSRSPARSASDSACDLEALIVESWLEEHAEFAQEYFLRRANRKLIDKWLLAHAKISNNNLAGACQSQLDLSSQTHLVGENFHQLRVISHRHSLSPKQQLCVSLHPTEIELTSQQQQRRLTNADFRSVRRRSQSGNALGRSPVRKISATDLESCTGSGSVLRPIVSTAPDGKPTFLSQLLVSEPSSSASELLQPSPALIGARTPRASTASEGGGELSIRARGSISASSPSCKRRSAPAVAPRISELANCGAQGELDESEVKLSLEIVKSVIDELDIRRLLQKMLGNICHLLNSQKCLIYLVCGDPDDSNRYLVGQPSGDQEQSFADSSCEQIAWGSGLVGQVAQLGELINISGSYQGERRHSGNNKQPTSKQLDQILCAPIRDQAGSVVGVAQVINKSDGRQFSELDELKLKQYLQFCGIGLSKAQAYERCQLENRRNEVLLDLARMVFEEQSTIEQVVYRIMLHTQSLLECQRCQVLIMDDGSEDLDQMMLNLATWPANTTNTSPQLIGSQRELEMPEQKPAWRPQCHQRTQQSTLADCVAAPDQPSTDVVDCSQRKGSAQPDVEASFDEMKNNSSKLFSLIFDFECESNDGLVMHRSGSQEKRASSPRLGDCSSSLSADGHQNPKETNFPINIGITGYVAMTGETLNIEDAHKCERFDQSVDFHSNFKHKSILCMPIRNGKREIVGVAQLINKKNGRPFNKNDEHLFEAFAIFCGLGIQNTLMYEKVLKVMAKQRVTFEVLSYHATAPLEEAQKLSLEQVPSCYALNLSSLKFNDFSLDDQYMLKACLRFFLDLDLIRRFQIDQLVLCNWILSVRKNYRQVTYHPIVGGDGLKASPVRYHNWRHAFNVSQMMFAILINTQICQVLGELETLALLIACLCHDLDHRGTNNSFQIKSASPLAELYSTSTMEHHHFDQCVMILNSQGNQILANLSPEEYSRVIVLLKEAILATDLANYFAKRERFFKLVNSGQLHWHQDSEHKSMLRCMLMTACDVAAITKPWPVQKAVADLVMSEFYQQGDYEKHELKIEPIDMMNREKMSKLPEMQIGFIDSVCVPIYTAFRVLFPHELGSLLDGCLSNRGAWSQISSKQQQTNNGNSFNSEIICAERSQSDRNNSIEDNLEFKARAQQPELEATTTIATTKTTSGALPKTTKDRGSEAREALSERGKLNIKAEICIMEHGTTANTFTNPEINSNACSKQHDPKYNGEKEPTSAIITTNIATSQNQRRSI